MDEDYCVVQFASKTRIFSWEPSTLFPGSVDPSFYESQAMSVFYANEFIEFRDAEGNTKRKALFPFWMKRAQRPSARGLIFDASGDRFVNGHLNLWSGFSVQPEEGDWSLIKRHISEVVCNGDDELEEYLLKWMAWVFQNPCSPAEVALILGGEKGTGKGIMAGLIRAIFGTHGLHISDRKHLLGAFNGHLLTCCLLFVDEALWPGDHQGDGVLKRMVTEPTLTYEPKGLTAFQGHNKLSLLMAWNAEWIVPATDDERRYACCAVSNKYRGNTSYFTALKKQIDSGGKAAFLHAMLNLDLGDWHPRYDVPQTAALRSQKQETAGPEIQWLWRLLEDGEFPSVQRSASGKLKQVADKCDPNAARSGALYEHFKASDKRLGYWSNSKFRKFIDRLGVIAHRRNYGVRLVFPPRSHAASGRSFPPNERLPPQTLS